MYRHINVCTIWRKDGVMSQRKAEIKEITLYNGEIISDAILDCDAQRITGFFPIKRSQDDEYIQYIAISAVANMIVTRDAVDNSFFGYYFCPEPKVKVI